MRDTLHLWDEDLLRKEWEDEVREHHKEVGGSFRLHPEGRFLELRRISNHRSRMRKMDMRAAKDDHTRDTIIAALRHLGQATAADVAAHIGVKAHAAASVLKALQGYGRVIQGEPRPVKIDGRNRQVVTWALKQEAAE